MTNVSFAEIAAILMAVAALITAFISRKKIVTDASSQVTQSAVLLIEPLKKRIADLDKTLEDLLVENSGLKESVNTLKIANESLKSQVRSLETENTCLSRSFDDLKSENQQLRDRVNLLEGANKSLRVERDDLQGRISDMEKELSAIKRRKQAE